MTQQSNIATMFLHHHPPASFVFLVRSITPTPFSTALEAK
jgi:hypothetical protein